MRIISFFPILTFHSIRSVSKTKNTYVSYIVLRISLLLIFLRRIAGKYISGVVSVRAHRLVLYYWLLVHTIPFKDTSLLLLLSPDITTCLTPPGIHYVNDETSILGLRHCCSAWGWEYSPHQCYRYCRQPRCLQVYREVVPGRRHESAILKSHNFCSDNSRVTWNAWPSPLDLLPSYCRFRCNGVCALCLMNDELLVPWVPHSI